MVRFSDGSLTVTVEAATVEDWMDLIDQLSAALVLASRSDPAMLPEGGLWRLADLIRELMPSWEDAMKMQG